MFFAWSVRNYLGLHKDPDEQFTGTGSTKTRMCSYDRGYKANTTTALRRFLKKLKTLKMLSQICGMSQDFHKLMKANARDFSGYRRSRISFGTYVQK